MQLLPTIQVLAVETKHKQKKSSIFFPKVRKSVQPTSTVRSKKHTLQGSVSFDQSESNLTNRVAFPTLSLI